MAKNEVPDDRREAIGTLYSRDIRNKVGALAAYAAIAVALIVPSTVEHVVKGCESFEVSPQDSMLPYWACRIGERLGFLTIQGHEVGSSTGR